MRIKTSWACALIFSALMLSGCGGSSSGSAPAAPTGVGSDNIQNGPDQSTDTDQGAGIDQGSDTDQVTSTDQGTDTDQGTGNDQGTDTDQGTSNDQDTGTNQDTDADQGTDTDESSVVQVISTVNPEIVEPTLAGAECRELPCTLVTEDLHRVSILGVRVMKNLAGLPTELDKMEIDIAVNPASDLQINVSNAIVTALQQGGASYVATPFLPPQLIDTVDINTLQTKAWTLLVNGEGSGDTTEDSFLRNLSITLIGNAPGDSNNTVQLSGRFNFINPTYSEFGEPVANINVEGCDVGETPFVLSVPSSLSIQNETDRARRLTSSFNQRLNGDACLEVIQQPSFEADVTTLLKLQSGEVDFYLRSYATAQQESASYLIFDLPFLFTDFDNVLKFQQGQGGEILKSASSAENLQVLAFLNDAPKQITLDSELERPADLTGKKIVASLRESTLLQEQYELVGAAGVETAFSEVNQLLITGAVDGTEYSWDTIDRLKLDEVQVGFADLNVRSLGHMVFTSTERWAEVDPDLRLSIESALIDENAVLDEEIKQREIEAKQALISRGAVITEIDDALHAEWVNSMATLWSKYQDSIGVDLINQALGAR